MSYTDEQLHDLITSNQELAASVRSLTRALFGAPKEGNPGVLPRLSKLEVQHTRYRWLLPFALFSGTATSGFLLKLFGI